MRDVDARIIVRAGAAIAAAILAAVLAVFALLHFAGVPPGGARLRFGDETPPAAPGLWSAPQPDLEQQRREKEARLKSGGWVDRDAGIAHIPIDDAMDLIVARRERR